MIQESSVIRQEKGRTFISAHLAISRARELAKKEAEDEQAFMSPKEKKKNEDDRVIAKKRHLDQAKKELMTQTDEAFKEVPTHLASGRPNPNHPAYSTHQAKFDKDKAIEKANRPATIRKQLPKPHEKVTLSHYFTAFDGIPDRDPHDAAHNLSKSLKISHEDAIKGLDKHAKAQGEKSFHDHYMRTVNDFKNGMYEQVQFKKTESSLEQLAESIRNLIKE